MTPIDIARLGVERVLALGADSADALVSEAVSLSTSCRLGKMEDVERAESRDLGLRALIGRRQAFVSGNGVTEESVNALAERVVAMAQMAPEDPYCGLADPALLMTNPDDMLALDLDDSHEPEMAELQEQALATEATARAVDGITNSEGAGAGWARGTTGLVTSHGFNASYTTSSWSLSCAVLGGEGDAMERDYASHSARHGADLDSPAEIGARAAERTLQRLNPQKINSQKAPVIFDTRISASLLGHFSAAISGTAIARGTSFLKDKMDTKVFADGITIIDDPRRPRGLRSVAFDGEGLAAEKLTPVTDGILQSWFLDSATGRQLDLPSNGRAARGIGGPPAPSATNLYMLPGTQTPEELMAAIGTGFFATELIGMGVNGVTGDYSRGAAGFWIENGKLAYPVSEVTIAGNLKDMFSHLTPASDLEFRRGVNAPTLLVEEMTLAGL
jgi:PmbA protein